MTHKQPELMNEWGTRFHGLAKTIDGDFWWYESDGKKYPLMPVHPQAGVANGQGRKNDDNPG